MKLLRSGVKGNFVLWPQAWGKRWLSPDRGRRFQTGCDMLIGGCACGRYHEGDDTYTQEALRCHDAEIESIQEWRERTHESRIATLNV